MAKCTSKNFYVVWLLIVIVLVTITICCMCGIGNLWGISKILGLSSSCIQAIADVITAIVALIALGYSINEYELHIKREKAATLLKYNERYANDPVIQKVVNYLLWRSDGSPYLKAWPFKWQKRIDATLYGGESEAQIKPTKNQVELFMRFYEELQTASKSGLLELEKIKKLFAYYAYVLVDIGGDLLPSDYPDGITWCDFQEFIKQTRNKK